MYKRKHSFNQVKDSYLFARIDERKQEFLKENPGCHLISLGIGDVKLPLAPSIAKAMSEKSLAMMSAEGFEGYGPYAGKDELRELTAQHLYKGLIDPDELFISDGSKCDFSRLLSLFSSDLIFGVQDPAYPAYIDAITLSREWTDEKLNEKLKILPGDPKRSFLPDLEKFDGDLFVLCNPNNPTGATLSKKELEEVVQLALKKDFLILYDSAYSAFISEENIPHSIYEIEGAKRCAIEIGTLSKRAGFTGIRLGWTIIPKDLEGEKKYLNKEWRRLISSIFNGPCLIAQHGAIASFSERGLKEVEENLKITRTGALAMKACLEEIGFITEGGTHCPFLWVNHPRKTLTSWELFELILKETEILTVPGSGFGSQGEGAVRISCFASPDELKECIERFKKAKDRLLA